MKNPIGSWTFALATGRTIQKREAQQYIVRKMHAKIVSSVRDYVIMFAKFDQMANSFNKMRLDISKSIK